jgi:hypothetical protein
VETEGERTLIGHDSIFRSVVEINSAPAPYLAMSPRPIVRAPVTVFAIRERRSVVL